MLCVIIITFPSLKILPNGFFGDFKCKHNLYYDKKINAINFWIVLIELDLEVPRSTCELFKTMVYKDCKNKCEFPRLQKGHTIAVFQPCLEIGDSF